MCLSNAGIIPGVPGYVFYFCDCGAVPVRRSVGFRCFVLRFFKRLGLAAVWCEVWISHVVLNDRSGEAWCEVRFVVLFQCTSGNLSFWSVFKVKLIESAKTNKLLSIQDLRNVRALIRTLCIF